MCCVPWAVSDELAHSSLHDDWPLDPEEIDYAVAYQGRNVAKLHDLPLWEMFKDGDLSTIQWAEH
jgi:hypothetical protein